jgi:hypothetical protein
MKSLFEPYFIDAKPQTTKVNLKNILLPSNGSLLQIKNSGGKSKLLSFYE